MNAQLRVLAVAAVVAITATATGCSSGPANQRIGGATQGISIEVPSSFGVVDLTSESTAVSSITKLGLTSTAVVQTLVQQAIQYQGARQLRLVACCLPTFAIKNRRIGGISWASRSQEFTFRSEDHELITPSGQAPHYLGH